MRILLVDDDMFSCMMLRGHLERKGHEALTASSATQAQELLSSDGSISLVITDWNMPDVSGPELCSWIRVTIKDRYLPAYLLTSRTEKEDLVAGLSSGADAFLSKPINHSELEAHLRVAQRFFDYEQRLAEGHRKIAEAHTRMAGDLRSAAAIQDSLLPARDISVPGVDIAWEYRPCDGVAGDMFNVFRMDERHCAFYILDVSGHGVQAALLSVTIARALTPYPQQGGILKRKVLTPPHYQLTSPEEVVLEINRQFPLMEQTGQYFTFLYGLVDCVTGHVRFARAGHPNPLILSQGGPVLLDLPGTLPIGIAPISSCPEGEVTLQPGETLIMYTDGIPETAGENGGEFGMDRIIDAFGSSQGMTLPQRLAALVVEADDFRFPRAQEDDITVIALEFQGREPSTPE